MAGLPPPYSAEKAQGGYPPQQPPGYSPYNQPGYPPQQQPGYPPQQQPGYPPQQQPGYPPQQQPGYPPQQPYTQGMPAQPVYPAPVQPHPIPVQTHAQSHVVVVTQPKPAVVAPVAVGPYPVTMQCPYCTATVTTAVSYHEGTLTWLLVLGMALFMIWPFCLIPFCVNGCKDVHHTCPNCHRQIGIYPRM